MRIFFLFILLSARLACFGQKLEVVKITGPESYKLNSSMRADLGGRSRLYVPLNIPSNALFCYITINTASGGESQQIQQGINLVGQLASVLPTPTAQGIAKLATLSAGIVGISKGSVVDVTLLPDFDDAQTFFSGRGPYQHWPQYTKSNYNGGNITMPCRGLGPRTIYLGLSNLNAINSAWINIEAVVVTYTAAPVKQQTIDANNYTNLGWKSYENGNIEKCMEYSQKALEYDSTEAVAILNLGLCHLIKKSEAEAVTLYMTALAILKQKEKSVRQHLLDEAIGDIRKARKKYPDMVAGEDIVDLFKMERDTE